MNCDGPVGNTGRRMCFYLDVAQRSFGFHMSVNPCDEDSNRVFLTCLCWVGLYLIPSRMYLFSDMLLPPWLLLYKHRQPLKDLHEAQALG